MDDPVPAKRCIGIFTDRAFKTSSPIVRKEFARTVSNGFGETMCRDTALSGCKCDSGFNLDEYVNRAAGMVRMLTSVALQGGTLPLRASSPEKTWDEMGELKNSIGIEVDEALRAGGSGLLRKSDAGEDEE